MKLKEHYDTIFASAKEKILSSQYQIDQNIDSVTDTRRGLTLLIRPNQEVLHSIKALTDILIKIEPQQYIYPSSDIHITVLSLISCYPNFNIGDIQLDDYIEIIQKSIRNISPFEIKYQGITASDSCIMLKGYYEKDTLDKLRNSLRESFKQSNIKQSVDSRYYLETAHSTILRIKKPLQDVSRYTSKIEELTDINLGSFFVNQIELVYNDWYQKSENVKLLATFKLE